MKLRNGLFLGDVEELAFFIAKTRYWNGGTQGFESLQKYFSTPVDFCTVDATEEENPSLKKIHSEAWGWNGIRKIDSGHDSQDLVLVCDHYGGGQVAIQSIYIGMARDEVVQALTHLILDCLGKGEESAKPVLLVELPDYAEAPQGTILCKGCGTLYKSREHLTHLMVPVNVPTARAQRYSAGKDRRGEYRTFWGCEKCRSLDHLEFSGVPESATLIDENIDDIMVTALEGYVYEWCESVKPVGKMLGEYASDQISRGGELKITESEDGTVHILDLAKFKAGFDAWFKDDGDRNGAVDAEGDVNCGQIDGEDADAIIQYALFGRLVYG